MGDKMSVKTLGNFKLGAVKGKDDARDYTIASNIVKTTFPKEFQLNRIPEIRQQGGVGSCVAHACAYINEYYDNKKFATGFIYGYRPVPYWSGQGMIVREACKTMLDIGNVLYADFPINIEVPQAINEVNSKLHSFRSKAALNKIESFARIYSINEMKSALLVGMPVIITIECYNDFRASTSSGILQNTPSTGYIGAHAMTAIGWTQIGGQTHYIILNSWGTSWGKKGICYIPESMMGNNRIVVEMFSLADTYHKQVVKRTLRKGMKGDDVRELQNLLLKLGYKLPKFGADSDFGGETDAAVRSFQKDKRLVVDGIVGKNTWAALE